MLEKCNKKWWRGNNDHVDHSGALAPKIFRIFRICIVQHTLYNISLQYTGIVYVFLPKHISSSWQQSGHEINYYCSLRAFPTPPRTIIQPSKWHVFQSQPHFRRSLGECWAQMRRKVARGATEWRDATQQLSVSCVTAVTEATAAVSRSVEAEGISITDAPTGAASQTSVAIAVQEFQDEGRGMGPVQIRVNRRPQITEIG